MAANVEESAKLAVPATDDHHRHAADPDRDVGTGLLHVPFETGDLPAPLEDGALLEGMHGGIAQPRIGQRPAVRQVRFGLRDCIEAESAGDRRDHRIHLSLPVELWRLLARTKCNGWKFNPQFTPT